MIFHCEFSPELKKVSALIKNVTETTRITFFQDGRRFGHPDQQVVVIGVIPNIIVLKLSDLEWFWIEEN